MDLPYSTASLTTRAATPVHDNLCFRCITFPWGNVGSEYRVIVGVVGFISGRQTSHGGCCTSVMCQGATAQRPIQHVLTAENLSNVGVPYGARPARQFRPVGAFSHRQPRLPEPFKEFFEARGIGNRYYTEKI